MIGRIRLILRREFLATVASKGFLIGILVMPVLIGLLVVVGPRIMASRSPQVHGDVEVIDLSGGILEPLRPLLAPEAIAARRAEGRRQSIEQVAPGWGRAAAQGEGPPVPLLTIIERPAGSPLAAEKAWLSKEAKAQPHLALVAIHADAVQRPEGAADYGGYDLYVSATVDETTENVLHESLREALVGARLKARGLDPAAVEAAMRVTRANPVIVAAGGELPARRGFNRALPFVMGLLLFIGVMTGGQTLMASTIEEKSSRVVEVLLAAVSPLELMWGKLLGQLGVGLLVMSVYIGLGLLGLFEFALLGLLDPLLVVYLIVFFLITYLVFGALMLAIGAAVNQVAEAQSLMGPVMLLLLAPYILAPIIGQAPNSTFSVAVSFIPPVNTFAILARLASGTPPPFWQVALSALVGIAAACVAVWFAAKIFKVGLLMHGRPPSFATLLRWARSA